MRRLLGHWLIVLTVEGVSMEPTLYHGERLLALRVRHRPGRVGVAGRRLRRGDIVVVVSHADEPWDARPPSGLRYLVKRVAALPNDIWEGEKVGPEKVILLGDNVTHSLDSRLRGPFALADVYARVARRMFSRRPLDLDHTS